MAGAPFIRANPLTIKEVEEGGYFTAKNYL
jgi:hypothetical protein